MWGKLKNGDSMTKLSISFQTETKAHKTSKKQFFQPSNPKTDQEKRFRIS